MIKTTAKASNDGPTYTISGLTFAHVFRIKRAMCHEAESLKKAIENELAGDMELQEMFKGYVKDCNLVFESVSAVC